MAFHEEKIKSQLIMLAAQFVAREASRQSIITVTGISLSRDGNHATVLCTVLPEAKEAEAIDFLRRQRTDFYQFVLNYTKGRKTPLFDFSIDVGEKSRQRLDKLFTDDKLSHDSK